MVRRERKKSKSINRAERSNRTATEAMPPTSHKNISFFFLRFDFVFVFGSREISLNFFFVGQIAIDTDTLAATRSTNEKSMKNMWYTVSASDRQWKTAYKLVGNRILAAESIRPLEWLHSIRGTVNESQSDSGQFSFCFSVQTWRQLNSIADRSSNSVKWLKQ